MATGSLFIVGPSPASPSAFFARFDVYVGGVCGAEGVCGPQMVCGEEQAPSDCGGAGVSFGFRDPLDGLRICTGRRGQDAVTVLK